jgi:hypothetical protein
MSPILIIAFSYLVEVKKIIETGALHTAQRKLKKGLSGWNRAALYFVGIADMPVHSSRR